MWKRRPLPFLVAAAMLASLPVPGARAGDLSKPNAKLDSALASIAEAGAGASGLDAARGAGFTLAGDRILVVVEGPDEAIRAAGGEVQQRAGALADVLLPLAGLPELEADGRVRSVQRPLAPVMDAVQGQGVALTHADSWHAVGYRGAGRKIAVIDGGFLGLADAQAAGDLPASLEFVSLCANPNATRHGTGVAEIVHEMAPQAALLLICEDSAAVDLPIALGEVKARGATVINTSFSQFATGRGDGSGGPGTLDAVLRDARASGILWTASSGNYARSHWSGTFSDTDSDLFHNYTPTDEGNSFNLSAGEVTCVYLKWDDWPVSDQDFDLYVQQSTTNVVVGQSTSLQTGTQAPREVACFTTPVAGTYYAAIKRFATTTTPRMDLWVPDTGLLQYPVPISSVGELSSSPETFAVAAQCPVGGGIHSYSSQGPTIDGRTKPDIAAPSPVSSFTYGATTTCNGGFGGTSAAAPHVAGAAGLFRQRFPTATPAEVQASLEGLAVDTLAPGKDPVAGAGSLNLPPFSHDLLVGANGRVAGDGLTGAAPPPFVRLKSKEGKKKVFELTLQNEGPPIGSLADILVVTGPPRSNGLRARYFASDGTDITAAVAGPGFAVALPGGGSAVVKLQLKVLKKSKKKNRSLVLQVRSAAEPSFLDQARARIRVIDPKG